MENIWKVVGQFLMNLSMHLPNDMAVPLLCGRLVFRCLPNGDNFILSLANVSSHKYARKCSFVTDDGGSESLFQSVLIIFIWF